MRSSALLAASLAVTSLPGCFGGEDAVSGSESRPSEDGFIQHRDGADPAVDANQVRVLYNEWAAGHEARGGDAFVGVRLAAVRSASSLPSKAQAIASLDLIDGSVIVQADGLEVDDADVWLVDNQDGGGVMPDVNDNMFKVGSLELLEQNNQQAIEVELPDGLLDTFRADLVVVTEPGASPVDGGILFGRVPLFNRIYTEERLMQERGIDPKGFVHTDVYVPTLNRLDEAVARGFLLFTQETFDGNGRTCDTCHSIENNFTIDPAYIATLDDDDPLFVHENDPALADLESPQMLRQLGLVKAGVDGSDKPSVLRGVPSLNGIATSLNVNAGECANAPIPDIANCGFPPNVGPVDLRGKPIMFGPLARARVREGLALAESTGWGGDGSHDGTLLSFAVGAINAHMPKTLNRQAGVDYRVPTTDEADDLLVFQLAVGRAKDVDTDLLAFTDERVELGRKLYDLNPGGCPDENGVPQCACQLDINGNPCGIPRPDVHNGAGCANCHFKGGANTELSNLSNVATRINLNFDIGTVTRPFPEADAITAQYGEERPMDCGLGRTTPADFEESEYCHYVTSWHPYSYNAKCDGGPQLPEFDCFWPGFPVPKYACDTDCGGQFQPPCNAWGPDVDNSKHVPGDMYIHGHNPAAFAAPYESGAPGAGLGWYLSEGSWCDSDVATLPFTIITAGMPNAQQTIGPFADPEAICEQLAQPLEWGADYGLAFCVSDAECAAYPGSTCDTNAGRCTNVPGCKCVDNSSCRGEFECVRAPGSPVDGWCVGLEKEGTLYDANNPDHVARAVNRVMVEPTPIWDAFAEWSPFGGPGRLPPGIPGAKGAACNVKLNGTPGGDFQCFGAQTCNAIPFDPTDYTGQPFQPGTCGADANWTPEVSKFCEITDTYPNNELPPAGFIPPSTVLTCEDTYIPWVDLDEDGEQDENEVGLPHHLPQCQQCIPFDWAKHAAWGGGTHTSTRKPPPGTLPPCWIEATTPPIESHCGRVEDEDVDTHLGYGDGTFTTPSVIESADTEPLFHNNSALTLEDAIAHYATDDFNESWGPRFPNFPTNLEPVHLSDADVDAIAAYIRQLGAVQNINQAQRALEQAWANPLSVPGDGRLAFAETELEDAMQLLEKSDLHHQARVRLSRARKHVARAFYKDDKAERTETSARVHMALAIYSINEARDLMISITDADDSEWTSSYFTPERNEAVENSISSIELSTEEAAFEAELESSIDA